MKFHGRSFFSGRISPKREAFSRLGRLEQLEERSLLAIDGPSPWQNPINPLDVNADGRTSVLDVLMVVDDLNSFGPRSLTATAPIGGAATIAESPQFGFVDVDGNGRVNNMDALLLVDAIEARDADDLVRFSVQATNAAGTPIDTINVNDTFFLEIQVQDLRVGTAARGVFSAYMDVLYNAALVSVDSTINPTTNRIEQVVFGADYPSARSAFLVTPGTIDEIGGQGGLDEKDGTPRVLARVPMKAIAAGNVVFTTDPKENPNTDVTIYRRTPPGAVAVENIEFLTDTLTVVGPTLPTISIADASAVVEGNAGTTPQTFTVTLSQAATSTVTVNYTTLAGSALPGDDFVGGNGVVTFNPGDTTKTITVQVQGDLLDEDDENYSVELSTPTGAEILDGSATAVITDDDNAPTISINSIQLAEGNAGNTAFQFVVTLSAVSGKDVQFNIATEDGTAAAGSDYTANSGQLTIPAGQTTANIVVQASGDNFFEADETFNVVLSNPVNAAIATGTGVGTILNDDEEGVAPLVRVRLQASNAAGQAISSVNVGDSFFIDVFVDDLRSATAALGVLSAYADINFPANLLNANGAAVFSASYPLNQTGNNSVDGLINEIGAAANASPTLGPDEIRLVRVPMTAESTGLANLTLDPADDATSDTKLFGVEEELTAAQIEFVNDDITINPAVVVPNLSIANASTTEGNTGTKLLNFIVSLSQATTRDITFSFATTGVSATANSDYQTTTGQATLKAGLTSFTISVPIIGDTTFESDETFNVALSNVQGATVLDGSALGTIINDDQDPGSTGRIAGLVYADTNNDAALMLGEPGIDGVTVRLIGVGASSSFVAREMQTGMDGQFEFTNVPAGTYELREVQSVYFMDGREWIAGGDSGTVGNDVFTAITLRGGDDLDGYRFGEWGLKAQFLSRKLFLNSFSREDWSSSQLAQVGSMFAFDEGIDGEIAFTLRSASANARVGLQVLNADGQVIDGASSPFGMVQFNLEDTSGQPVIVRVTGTGDAELTLEHSDPTAAIAAALAFDDAEEADGFWL